MKWINRELTLLSIAQGNQAVAIGGLLGFITGLFVALSQGVRVDIALMLAFVSIALGAVVLTGLFVLLAKVNKRIS